MTHIKGKKAYNQPEKADGQEAAQKAQNDSFKDKGKTNKIIGGAHQTKKTYFILAVNHAQTNYIGNDKKRGQQKKASQKKTDGFYDPVKRFNSFHPLPVKLNILNTLFLSQAIEKGCHKMRPGIARLQGNLKGRWKRIGV